MGIEVIEPVVGEVVQEDIQEELQEENEQVEQEESGQDDEGDVVVTIGDAEPDEEEEAKAAPQWVKDLRRERKEDKKRIRELEQEVAKVKPKAEVPAVGPEPSIEDPDVDYDSDKFKAKYAAWFARKQQAEAAERDKQRDIEEQQKAWQQTLDTYQTSKSSLKVKDFEDAEELVVGAFSETQQGVILSGAENAALVVYALGKNPKKSAELSAIKDPIKFAFAIAKLEGQLKVQARKPATKPEGSVSGTAPKSGAVDNQLERLRDEAAKTGDYTKVTAYKNQLKSKKQA